MTRRARRTGMLGAAVMLTLGGFAPAATRTWNTNSSASFNIAGNWDPAFVPGSSDLAVFRRGNGVTYNVFLPNGGTTNDQLRVGFNNVTLMPTGSSTYTLGNASLTESGRAIIVGDVAGIASDVSQLTISIGVSAAAATVGDVGVSSSSNLNVTNGSLNITGSGLFDHELIVGKFGNGAMNVSGTSTVNVSSEFGDFVLGRYASGVGVATISGASASVTVGNQVDVGYLGEGALFVNSGADVTSSDSLIGVQAGSSGSVQVFNAGSTFTIADSLAIGYGGEGSLAVEPGGSASGVQVHIGSLQDSFGGVTVNGGTFTSTGFLGVGYEGSGTLLIIGGGTVTTNACFVASEPGSTANVEVNGAGSSWTSSGLNLGEHGAAIVNISAGGSISAPHVFIANHSDSSATVTITGPGSTLNATTNGLFVGQTGDAVMNVLAGADVNTTGFSYVGYNDGSVSTATIDGNGSTWTSNGDLSIGNNGNGTLNIQAGADVTSINTEVGGSTGLGTVLVTGSGSTWTSTGDLSVGVSGTGTLNIESGGSVSVDGLASVGEFLGGLGTVNVTGSGSLLDADTLIVGGQFGGNGQVNVLAGGDAVSTHTAIGINATGVLTVDGAGSTFNTGQVNVSVDGNGTLNIQNGGSVTSTFVNIGTFATDAVGIVNVSGSGSSWTINNETHLARDGATGALNVSGGAVTINANLVDDGVGGTSTVNITGGTVTLNGHYVVAATMGGAGTTTLTLDGGTLDMTNHVIGFTTPIDVLNFRSGKLQNVLNINNGAGLTKTTSGTLTLEGSMTYSGPTVVSGGTLHFNTDHTNGSSLTIADDAIARIVSSTPTPHQNIIRTGSLTIGETGKLDIRDNKAIVTGGSIGSWNGSAYTGLTGLVQLGHGDGNWNGAGGIVTSMTDATSGVITTVAIALAEDTPHVDSTFGGVPVSAGHVLLMYTWGGDADLNGELNGDDYFFIDSNILTQIPGFHNGDFDYSGVIDGDDYFIIDSNITFAQNSTPFPTGASAGGGGVAAVPEPAVISAMFALVPSFRRRRRS